MADPGMTAGQGARPGVDAAGSAEGGREAGRETRPLVTFALFAYNQEAFIREAVEGAFAQTYSPLEIILSDDCSSDRTFQIMQDMAAAYRGPHRVVVRQSPKNRRLMGHINDVVAVAQGGIIVMAAGDDVSLPERTAEHVAIYTRWPETHAVCSDYFTMSSKVVAVPDQGNRALREITLFRCMSNVGGWGAGAAYSYRRECFHWPVAIPEHIEIEDRVLPTRAALMGRVAFHKGRLVRYRTPAENGQLEEKRRWQQAKSLEPIVVHLRDILASAHSEGRIGKATQLYSIFALRIGFLKVTLANTPGSRRAQGLREGLALAIGLPTQAILRFQRLLDFYSPLVLRSKR